MNIREELFEKVCIYKNNLNEENKEKLELELRDLICSIIRRSINNDTEVDIIYQSCIKSVIDAIEKHQFNNYDGFINIIRTIIRKSLMIYISEKENSTIPVHIKALIKEYIEVVNQFWEIKKSYPSNDEISKIMGLPLDKVEEIGRIVKERKLLNVFDTKKD